MIPDSCRKCSNVRYTRISTTDPWDAGERRRNRKTVSRPASQHQNIKNKKLSSRS